MGSREKILLCAKELFYQVGYQTTSVDDIVRQSGVAKSNFYYHFQSKEMLGLEVLEDRMADYERILLRSLNNRELAPSDRLRQFCSSIQTAHAEVTGMAGCPVGNLAAALPSREQDAWQERFRGRIGQFFRMVESAAHECFREGMERGEFREDVPASDLAAFLVATVQGLMVVSKTYRDSRPLAGGLEVLQQLLRPR
jgi:TetR/AcrR family transcriptional repressor of nem operon